MLLLIGKGSRFQLKYSTFKGKHIDPSQRKVVLKERVDVNHIEIGQNGMLVFGEPNGDAVELRAKSVNVTDQGSFWIGSRSCRYQHEGYVTLYGNHTD